MWYVGIEGVKLVFYTIFLLNLIFFCLHIIKCIKYCLIYVLMYITYNTHIKNCVCIVEYTCVNEVSH